MNIPGLSEALENLDVTVEQMEALNESLSTVVDLMREQNDYLRQIVDNTYYPIER